VMGVCTSSATVGPSISFGIADAAIVMSDNVALADACASMLGNLVQSDDGESMSRAVDAVAGVNGVTGCAAIVGDRIAFKGSLPRMVQAEGTFSMTARILFPAGNGRA
jgi:ApbE superfamily uncharacterized protein (UPF0280 family)